MVKINLKIVPSYLDYAFFTNKSDTAAFKSILRISNSTCLFLYKIAQMQKTRLLSFLDHYM